MKYVTTLVLVLLLITSGCVSFLGTEERSSFNYTIHGCESTRFLKQSEQPLYTYRNGHLLIHFNLDYVCCANLSINEKLKDNEIEIYIDNLGEMCRCVCVYPVDIIIGVKEGTYDVKIFGVKYRDIYNYSLMYNFTVDTSRPRECTRDKDCIHTPSCCHVKSQECIPSFMENEINCVGVACTMECRQCKACFCKDGKCISKNVDGCC